MQGDRRSGHAGRRAALLAPMDAADDCRGRTASRGAPVRISRGSLGRYELILAAGMADRVRRSTSRPPTTCSRRSCREARAAIRRCCSPSSRTSFGMLVVAAHAIRGSARTGGGGAAARGTRALAGVMRTLKVRAFWPYLVDLRRAVVAGVLSGRAASGVRAGPDRAVPAARAAQARPARRSAR